MRWTTMLLAVVVVLVAAGILIPAAHREEPYDK